MSKRPLSSFAFTSVLITIALVFGFSLAVSSAATLTSTSTHTSAFPATDGDLDPTFGNGGNVSTGFPVPIASSAYASALQSDGKLLVAGAAGGVEDTNENDFAITRYNTDGTLDNTFGANGRVQTDFAGNEDQINGLAVQPDGKIVAAGFARMGCCTGYEDFALARYNSNGTLDTGFGTDGLVHTDIASAGDKIYDVKLQGDGKIVAAGTASSEFALARYNTNGTLDTSFGSGGIVTTYFADFDQVAALAIQLDGKIVAVGSTYNSENYVLNIALARYNANGTLDSSFGNGGKVTTSINSDEVASAVVIQPADNKIVIAGDTYYPGSGTADAVLVRYNTNGSLDTSFNSTGIVITDLGASDDGFNSLIIQSNNMLVAAGKSGEFNADNFALARYTSSGSLDSSFGLGGIVLTAFGTSSSDASRLLLQTNGRLVASGTSSDYNLSPSLAQVAARYNTDGTLDNGFGTDGKVTTYQVRSAAAVSKIEIQSDGKIVAAGNAGFDIALARYNTDGTLDATFGTGGTVTTTNSLGNLTANGLTLQNDGKIVTVGEGRGDSEANEVALVRYNTNGTLDTGFGTGGIVMTDIGVGSVDAYDVKQRPDGKLVALAYDGYFNAVLIRYNANGTLDGTFGTGGIVRDTFIPAVSLSTLLLQGDGKIVIAGSASRHADSNMDLMVARYNADGTPDSSFNTNGRLFVDFGSDYEEAMSAAIQPDGKIVLGGYYFEPGVGYEWPMARCNPDGTLDDTFGNGGKVLTDFPTDGDTMLGLKLLPDGRIIGSGYPYGRVARFNSDGSLDSTFGNSGTITNSAMSGASGLTIQADNKIVVGGDGYSGSDRNFILARYTNSLTTQTPTPRPTATPTTCATGWRVVPWPGEADGQHLNAAKAWSSNNVWTVGVQNDLSFVVHWDGSQWSVVPSPSISDRVNTLFAIDGSAPNNMWAVGNTFDMNTGYSNLLALHWDGGQWTMATLPTPPGYFASLNGVKSLAADDVWAVGHAGDSRADNTLALHWDGVAWSIVPSPNPAQSSQSKFNAVAAYASNDVWAVGDGTVDAYLTTLIEHWNGSQWSIMSSPNVPSEENVLSGVSVASQNSVWAVGGITELGPPGEPKESLVLHWDGTSWATVASPNPTQYVYLTATSAVASNDVWAVGYYQDGEYGSLYHTLTVRWNGTDWQVVTSPSPSDDFNVLNGISVLSSAEAWAVGDQDIQWVGHTLLAEQYQDCAALSPSPSPSPSRPTATATGTATSTAVVTEAPTDSTTPSSSMTSVATGVATITTATATPTATACSLQFTDVPQGSTFYPYIHCLACLGIINGYQDGSFKPNNNVTRGQLSKIISNAAGFSDTQTVQMFQDVPAGSTFFQFIGRLASRGYIGGYACGGVGEPCSPPANLPYFRPNNNATRGQISKIDANAAGFGDTPSGQEFEDVAAGSTYYTYTYRLVSRSVMGGYQCGGAGEPCVPPGNLPYFRPNDNATRGQTSKIVGNTFFPDCVALSGSTK